jgi:hypothetical protein
MRRLTIEKLTAVPTMRYINVIETFFSDTNRWKTNMLHGTTIGNAAGGPFTRKAQKIRTPARNAFH